MYDWKTHFRGELRQNRFHGEMHGDLYNEREEPTMGFNGEGVLPLGTSTKTETVEIKETKKSLSFLEWLGAIGSVASTVGLALWFYDQQKPKKRRS